MLPSFWGGSLSKKSGLFNQHLHFDHGPVGRSSWSFRNSSVLPCLSGWQRLANDTQNVIQNWLVVEPTHLKNIRQNGNHLPKIFGMNITKIIEKNHHLVDPFDHGVILSTSPDSREWSVKNPGWNKKPNRTKKKRFVVMATGLAAALLHGERPCATLPGTRPKKPPFGPSI